MTSFVVSTQKGDLLQMPGAPCFGPLKHINDYYGGIGKVMGDDNRPVTLSYFCNNMDEGLVYIFNEGWLTFAERNTESKKDGCRLNRSLTGTWMRSVQKVPFVKSLISKYDDRTMKVVEGSNKLSVSGMDSGSLVTIDLSTVPAFQAHVILSLFRFSVERLFILRRFMDLKKAGIPDEEAVLIASFYTPRGQRQIQPSDNEFSNAHLFSVEAVKGLANQSEKEVTTMMKGYLLVADKQGEGSNHYIRNEDKEAGFGFSSPMCNWAKKNIEAKGTVTKLPAEFSVNGILNAYREAELAKTQNKSVKDLSYAEWATQLASTHGNEKSRIYNMGYRRGYRVNQAPSSILFK